jgi:predicted Zn-dependent protease
VQRNPWWLGTLAFAYAENGQAEEARTLLNELALGNPSHYVPRVLLARAYLALGEHERAFRVALEALEAREMSAWGILGHPAWRELYDHPNHALLARAVPMRQA